MNHGSVAAQMFRKWRLHIYRIRELQPKLTSQHMSKAQNFKHFISIMDVSITGGEQKFYSFHGKCSLNVRTVLLL